MTLTPCLPVFISYSHEDQGFAFRIEKRLTALGRAAGGQALVDVWIDRDDITAGYCWRGEIEAGLRRADVVLLIRSPDALESRYVVREVRTALHDRTKSAGCLLPLHHREVDRDQLSPSARRFEAIVSEFQWIEPDDLDARIELYWRARIERQRSPAWKLRDERRFICDLFQIPHPWVTRYFAGRVHDLMTAAPPDPSRAQYYVHALKFIAAPNREPVLDDLVGWWRSRFTDKVTTSLLEQARLLEKPPACY